MLAWQIKNDGLVDIINNLTIKGQNVEDLMKGIGEILANSTKERFQKAEAPDGTPWVPNSETTLSAYLSKHKSNFTQSGDLSKSGRRRLGNKKPLQGETRALSTTIAWQLVGSVLYIGSPVVYAATQQLGAKKGAFGIYNNRPTPWGDIPARPYLGISDDDEIAIIDFLQEYYSTR